MERLDIKIVVGTENSNYSTAHHASHLAPHWSVIRVVAGSVQYGTGVLSCSPDTSLIPPCLSSREPSSIVVDTLSL